MIKKLVLVFIAAFAVNSYAQDGGTTSPYSYYGIGTNKFKGTVENKSMGGLGVYSDSIHINLQNPASYASKNLKMYNDEGRPVKFAIGGSSNNTTLKNSNISEKASSTTFDYVSLSIPIGRFGVGFGVRPFSSVGYKLQTENADGGIKNRFEGEGGLNKVYLSAGYLVTDGLSVGVEASYGFGNTKNSVLEYLYDTDGDILTYQTKQNDRSDLSGMTFNFGVIYKTLISDEFEWMSSATYTPAATITSKNYRSFSTITVNASTGEETIIETIDGEQSLIDEGKLETDVNMASKFTIGTGIGQQRHWFVGVEGTFTQTSGFSNEHQNSNVDYEDAFGLSVGGFYIPNYNAFTGYWNRVVYRAGFRTESSGLVINDEPIDEFGISFGAGLPLGNVFSNANIGFEIGKRGTTNAGLIKENFINFNISLSLNDRWFVKRKYD